MDSTGRGPTKSLHHLFAGGARGMGLQHQIGRIEPGYAADLVLVDLDTIAFTPLNDVRRQLVFCETGSSVELTMVDGRIATKTASSSPSTRRRCALKSAR